MIKASYPILKESYRKLFNIILSLGIYPKQWCNGLITPYAYTNQVVQLIQIIVGEVFQDV